MSARVVDLDVDLAWSDFSIPDSSGPVGIATLRAEPSRAVTLAVRFPKGWKRPPAGWYSAAEEIVVLEGTLAMGGEVYRAGHWAYAPASVTRVATAAQSEVLTVARFDGPPRWTLGFADPSDAVLSRALTAGPDPTDSPLGSGRAWLLRRGSADAAWITEPPVAGSIAPSDAELVALDSRLWAFIPAGGALPGFDELCFCRTFRAEGEEP